MPGLSEWDSGFGELLHHVHYFSTAKIAGKRPTMIVVRGGPAIIVPSSESPFRSDRNWWCRDRWGEADRAVR